MKTALIVTLALLAQPFAAHAQVVNPAMEMTSLTPAQLAAKFQAMSPEERKDVLESYRAYLTNLDRALKEAQNYSVTNHGRSVEVKVLKVGYGFMIAGGLILVPSLYMTPSRLVIASFFGQLGLRVAGGVAGFGALLLAGAGVSAGTKLTLNAIQISKLRKSIAHIRGQLTEIETLTLK
jgi:ribosomal protein L29